MTELLNSNELKDLYKLKINCKGKTTVREANKGISVEKNNKFKKLKLNKTKRKTPQNCKRPIQRQGVIIIKNVTKEKKRRKNPEESTEQVKT